MSKMTETFSQSKLKHNCFFSAFLNKIILSLKGQASIRKQLLVNGKEKKN